MTNLLLIRHAETDMAGTFCGSSDPRINAAGYLQICELGERLRHEPLEAVYSSGMRRAYETAHAVAEMLHVPCFIREELREIGFGRWEGLCWEQIELADPELASEWLRMFPRIPAPEGETHAAFEKRVLAEASYLSHEIPFRKIAVVTHAGVMRTMLRHFTAMDERKAWELTKPYCAVVPVVAGPTANDLRECNRMQRDAAESYVPPMPHDRSTDRELARKSL